MEIGGNGNIYSISLRGDMTQQYHTRHIKNRNSPKFRPGSAVHQVVNDVARRANTISSLFIGDETRLVSGGQNKGGGWWGKTPKLQKNKAVTVLVRMGYWLMSVFIEESHTIGRCGA
jgi:cephalosporin-C deacetylase-like acetyl esterase